MNKNHSIPQEESAIIAARKQAYEEKCKSIYSAFTYVGGKRYHFAEREILAAWIQVRMPSEFIEMPSAFARVKYPSEDRPDIITTSFDLSVNFAFSLLSEPASDEGLTINRNASREAMQKVFPQNTYMESQADYTKESRLYTWFDYYGPTLDVDIYTVNAFTRIKQRLLHIMFCCAKSDSEHWKPAVLEMLSSIAESKRL